MFLERTMVQPFSGVSQEFAALLAQHNLATMVIPAEAAEHSLRSLDFTLQASRGKSVWHRLGAKKR